MGATGKFFPDFGSYGTGNPLLDIMSGFNEEEEEEELDPFDIDMDIDAFAAAALPDTPAAALPVAPAAAAPAAVPAEPPVRTLQQKQFVNDEREAEKKRKEALEAAANPEKGRGVGQGLWTGNLQSGGFGTGRRVGTKGWDD